MARIVENSKGFKVIELTKEEGKKVGWGSVCCNCNSTIEGNMFYICGLNDVMDKKCFEQWLRNAKFYPEDVYYETRLFECARKQLGL